jgi:hypothetical protein
VHIYTGILEPEESKTQEMLAPIAMTTAINRPAASGHSTGGNPRGSGAASQLRDHAGSSDKNDNKDEDDEDPPAVIDKSKKSTFTRELAGLDWNFRSAWEAPAGYHQRRSRTHPRRWNSGRLEIESTEADRLGQTPL